MGIGKFVKGGAFGGLGAVPQGLKTGTAKNILTGGAYGNNKTIADFQNRILQKQDQSKQAQLQTVGSMKAPVMSEATQARINALKQESQAVPLSQNASFQGDRANLVQNARQEVGGVQNKSKAYGVSGGFSNVGSVQDNYDRLSGQLSSLGQQAKQRQLDSGSEAQSLEQQMADRQIDFQNEQAKLRLAIEQGDLQSAQAAYERLVALKTGSNTAGAAETGKLIGQVGGTAAKGASGGAKGASGGAA